MSEERDGTGLRTNVSLTVGDLLSSRQAWDFAAGLQQIADVLTPGLTYATPRHDHLQGIFDPRDLVSKVYGLGLFLFRVPVTLITNISEAMKQDGLFLRVRRTRNGHTYSLILRGREKRKISLTRTQHPPLARHQLPYAAVHLGELFRSDASVEHESLLALWPFVSAEYTVTDVQHQLRRNTFLRLRSCLGGYSTQDSLLSNAWSRAECTGAALISESCLNDSTDLAALNQLIEFGTKAFSQVQDEGRGVRHSRQGTGPYASQLPSQNPFPRQAFVVVPGIGDLEAIQETWEVPHTKVFGNQRHPRTYEFTSFSGLLNYLKDQRSTLESSLSSERRPNSLASTAVVPSHARRASAPPVHLHPPAPQDSLGLTEEVLGRIRNSSLQATRKQVDTLKDYSRVPETMGLTKPSPRRSEPLPTGSKPKGGEKQSPGLFQLSYATNRVEVADHRSGVTRSTKTERFLAFMTAAGAAIAGIEDDHVRAETMRAVSRSVTEYLAANNIDTYELFGAM
ncbi:hypothetical protein GMRT_13291 [Giardia muris]|uniref:Uncharacterized protein n=1 Tax=Giardia muris TaxID=5742 RepID=A0A4Z1SN38_GIAMU|nr:hypothetical protein GMRT_13291 [Giardia muris]|eukprot:TNJ26255.1 hypothetical protein GMRT_13291 [Giardia muris]